MCPGIYVAIYALRCYIGPVNDICHLLLILQVTHYMIYTSVNWNVSFCHKRAIVTEGWNREIISQFLSEDSRYQILHSSYLCLTDLFKFSKGQCNGSYTTYLCWKISGVVATNCRGEYQLINWHPIGYHLCGSFWRVHM